MAYLKPSKHDTQHTRDRAYTILLFSGAMVLIKALKCAESKYILDVVLFQ